MAVGNKIIIDVRMMSSSGIGRYLASIIGEWRKEGRQFCALRGGGSVYGIKEQVHFGRLFIRGMCYWIPHYNIPIFSFGRVFATVHDVAHLALPEIFNSKVQRLYAWIMLFAVGVRCEHVFFVSEFSKSEYRRILGFLPKRSSVVPCGVDYDYWSGGQRFTEGPKYFIAVGNIKPHKNLKGVLAAFDLVKAGHPDVVLKIVGKIDGLRTKDSEVVGLIARTPGVQMVGEVSDLELRDLYASAEGLVFPSLYEGFGLPPLEAMAAGCPSVVSRTGALPEICGGGLGEFCDPLNHATIATGMLRLLSQNEQERVTWRIAARGRVRQYSWDKSAGAIWAELNRIG